MDKELLYNASGAKDETAYKAIINVMKERRAMGVNNSEIWEVENSAGTIKLVVVLNCYEQYAATVMLNNYEPDSNAVKVRARDIMYADAGRLGWIYYDKMVEFVRALSQEELQELRRAIGTALDIEPYESAVVDANREIEKLRGELEVAYDQMEANAARVDELEALAAGLRNELKEEKAAIACQGTAELVEEYGIREELAAAQREAQIYKGLYENMLSRALGA